MSEPDIPEPLSQCSLDRILTFACGLVEHCQNGPGIHIVGTLEPGSLEYLCVVFYVEVGSVLEHAHVDLSLLAHVGSHPTLSVGRLVVSFKIVVYDVIF